MASTCGCTETTQTGEQGELLAYLAGNPNVGKSSLFNRLTGEIVETANYAGMTVALNGASVRWGGKKVELIDLPGTYALGAVSEDQYVARRALLERHPDVVIAVVDATNLARNLYLVLQLLDLGFRMVVALDLVDEAERRNTPVDDQALSRALGVPVVPTVAPHGIGIERLTEVALATATSANGLGRGKARPYAEAIETRRAELASRLASGPAPFGLSPQAAALAILEGDGEIAAVAGLPADALADQSDDAMPLRIASERHGLARRIASEVVDESSAKGGDRWWRLTTSSKSGLPILFAVLCATFALLFEVGGLLSHLLTSAWTASAAPLITSAVHAITGHGFIASTLLWGLNGGILAALSVGIPYILTFYFLLALLEDSGYLNAAAFLSDRVMHRFGLHGRAAIPLIAAAGCNVPAIIGTRVLTTMRERIIASVLDHPGALQRPHGGDPGGRCALRRLGLGAVRLWGLSL